ncbi:RNA polymerase factor sigma-54 [Yoonia sp.]|uniref:RNA polymerase factor sigma-54 n=1 Tax=Yoonia sp. TaxID=2212373 RepID=UPI0040471F91
MLHMTPNAHLAQKQSLVFTPQLQQAIKLLLFNNLELSNYVEKIAEENPFVEVELPEMRFSAPRIMASSQRDASFDPISLLADRSDQGFAAQLFAQVDDILTEQSERAIGYAIASHVDPSGWLAIPTPLLADNLGVDDACLCTVLRKLQSAEPAGLFARNLAECLALQIAADDPDRLALLIVMQNLVLVERGAIPELRRKIGCSAEDVKRLLRRLREFNPKPGLALSDDVMMSARAPDILAARGQDGEWYVELNGATLPILKVDEVEGRRVRKLVKHDGDQAYVRDTLGNARWLKRAIAQRNETSIKVAAEIVRFQKAFLEHGMQHMRPLKLKTVADAVGLHESTISRVTSSLMMQTPQGSFPLKTFFSTAIELDGTDEGVSARMVREKIRNLIGAENPSGPLSDEFIAQSLQCEGLSIARRTIAKYRKLDKIPSSSQRRRAYRLRPAV